MRRLSSLPNGKSHWGFHDSLPLLSDVFAASNDVLVAAFTSINHNAFTSADLKTFTFIHENLTNRGFKIEIHDTQPFFFKPTSIARSDTDL